MFYMGERHHFPTYCIMLSGFQLNFYRALHWWHSCYGLSKWKICILDGPTISGPKTPHFPTRFLSSIFAISTDLDPSLCSGHWVKEEGRGNGRRGALFGSKIGGRGGGKKKLRGSNQPSPRSSLRSDFPPIISPSFSNPYRWSFPMILCLWWYLTEIVLVKWSVHLNGKQRGRSGTTKG